ncbi:MAG: hypothetical protein K8J31_09625, partial [Anaerolineae bacterium]|nr:hypothetical protein [Anaerolineae bacterium]
RHRFSAGIKTLHTDNGAYPIPVVYRPRITPGNVGYPIHISTKNMLSRVHPTYEVAVPIK